MVNNFSVILAAILGFIEILDYNIKNKSFKKLLKFCQVAIIFTAVGFQLGTSV
ncbi:hypothetical protein [Clostridium sp. UBA1652]|uniref:hypothetical protein n=1 Tax=Clostridium sp. UBA1652 TaxID=1946348 RepID=UPI00257ED235|nr:hypothetical protein [Clostridium sp. UBA1652]